MPLNPNIISGLEPFRIDSPNESMTKRLTLQNLIRSSQAGEMEMQDAQRVRADDVAMRGYAQQSGGDAGKLRDLLYGGGMYKQGQAQDALIAARSKAVLDGQKTQGDIDQQKAVLIAARLKQSREYLTDDMTPEAFIQWNEANHKDPVLGPVLAARGITPEATRARIAEVTTREGFQKLLAEARMGVEKFAEANKPTFQSFSVPGVGVQTGVSQGGQFTPGKNYASSDVISTEAEAQKVRIAKAGRSPTQPNPVQSQFFIGADGNVYEVAKGGGQATPVVDKAGKPLAAAAFNPDLQAAVAAGKEGGKTSIENADKDYKNAQVSFKAIPKIDALIAQLERGDVKTGFAGDIVLGLNKAMALLGGSEAAKRASNTEIADVMMGSEVFPLMSALGIGARGLDTPKEVAFLRAVLTGSILLEKDTLLQMARMRKEVTQGNIDTWNASVENGSRDRYFEATKIPKGKFEIQTTSKSTAPVDAAAAKEARYQTWRAKQ